MQVRAGSATEMDLAPGSVTLSLCLTLKILKWLLHLQQLRLCSRQENEGTVKGKRQSRWSLSPFKELSKKFQDVTSTYIPLKR